MDIEDAKVHIMEAEERIAVIIADVERKTGLVYVDIDVVSHQSMGSPPVVGHVKLSYKLF